MLKLKKLFLVEASLSALFTIFLFSFGFSILPFCISAVATVIFFWFLKNIFSENFDAKFWFAERKLLDYFSFIHFASYILRHLAKVPFAIDVILSILWTALFVYSFWLHRLIDEKHLAKNFPELKNFAKGKKVKGKAFVLFETLDWIDAFLWSILFVTIIQIFIFQLYAIPSESMVPEFLIGDRVLVTKFNAGPSFPLSKVEVPRLHKYKRSEIVPFRNPHYSRETKDEIHTFWANLVYMMTFTLVNLNVDEKGELKADPLVKRICGMPGEQLMLVDGELFARTKENPEFRKLAEPWAKWNLNTLPSSVKKSVQTIPFSNEIFEKLEKIEKIRRELNLEDAKNEIEKNAKNFLKKKNANFQNGDFQLQNPDLQDVFSKDTFAKTIQFGNNDFIEHFLLDWTKNFSHDFTDDKYSEMCFKYDVLAKLYFSRLLNFEIQFLLDEKNAEKIFENDDYKSLLDETNDLQIAIYLLNSRAMPIFPKNVDGKRQYLPENCFFMMGDNRFNSLDMRHSYTRKTIPLTEFDENSIYYSSNVDPQYISTKDILGTSILRFWPPKRIGILMKKWG